MFLSFDHRLLGRDATTAADSLDEPLDNIYTDSNDDGATVHGQSVHFGPSLKDKIIAFSSIGLFTIAFIIYLYFFIAPIIRARKQSARSKALTSASKSPLVEKIGVPKRDSTFSFTFVNSNMSSPQPSPSSSPEIPRRIVCRDSVGLTKTKRQASIFDMEPFLDNFPLPPAGAPQSQQPNPTPGGSPPSSPIMKTHGSDHANFVPESAPVKIAEGNHSFVALPSLQKLAPIVVLSDSHESISAGRILVSPSRNGSGLRSLQDNASNEHASLLATFPPKEPGTGLRPLNLTKGRSQPVIRKELPSGLPSIAHTKSVPAFQESKPPLMRKSTSHLKELKLNSHSEAPLYADLILPGYCRSQSQADALKLHSHTVRDSLFVRAAGYAQKLVGAASPPKESTELHFEMVKGDHGV